MFFFKYSLSKMELSWSNEFKPDTITIKIKWREVGSSQWNEIYSGQKIYCLQIPLPHTSMEASFDEEPGGGEKVWSDPENVVIIP